MIIGHNDRMSRLFRPFSTAGAALTLNALRPAPGSNPLAIPSFFASWLTAELAPHNLAITVTGTAAHLARHPRDWRDSREERWALAANAASIAGLSAIIRQSQRARRVVEEALCAGLGDDYLDRLDPRPSAPDLATPWRQLVQPFRFQHPGVEAIRDVQYTGTGPRQRLDIYRPEGGGSGLPVLLQIHGGAWMVGAKHQQGLPLMHHLAAHGWVCVAPNYRLSPKHAWPAHLVDLKAALSWVKENIASYGGNPDFIAVTGESAGGHLAAMVALTQNDPRYQPGFESADTTVQACVPFYGVYDLAASLGTFAARQRRDFFLGPQVFKRKAKTDLAIFEEASPLLLVDADAPPFFVIHGAHDSLVPVKEARAFVDRLRQTSRNPVVYAELPGAQHAFDIFPSIRSAHVTRAVTRFVRWVHAGYEVSDAARSAKRHEPR